MSEPSPHQPVTPQEEPHDQRCPTIGNDDLRRQTPTRRRHEPREDAEWDEPLDELPPRPRRRLLGVGASPVPLALLGVLLLACGFIGGVLVEKGQSPSGSAGGGGAAGLASRFAALRGTAGAGAGAGGTSTGGASGTSTGATAAGGSAAGGGFFGRSGGAAGAGATAGQVAYLSGSTLYVTTAEGNTVKVTTSPASTVTKTVKADVKGIHPGETVIVTGAAGTNGAVSAESIRVGAGAAGGGLGALFGGSGSGGGGRRGSSGGSSGGGEPALFGNGG